MTVPDKPSVPGLTPAAVTEAATPYRERRGRTRGSLAATVAAKC